VSYVNQKQNGVKNSGNREVKCFFFEFFGKLLQMRDDKKFSTKLLFKIFHQQLMRIGRQYNLTIEMDFREGHVKFKVFLLMSLIT
jgi:hypothetical protein